MLKDSSFRFGQPLFFEIPRIPKANPYSSLLTDKDNRLFITNDHEVFIYDGENYQQFEVSGKPTIAYDGKDRVIVAGYNYLTLLTRNHSGGYTPNQLIGSSENVFKHQITSIGFDESQNIYFSSGSTLWRYAEKPIAVDSSNQTITIYSTPNGLVFHSTEKGYYTKNGKSVNAFNAINQHILPDEKTLRIMDAGSYLFVSTSSNRILMLDNQGRLIRIINSLGNNSSDLPVDICTSDNITFFAITPTQLFRFRNPILFEVFNSSNNLIGVVRSARSFGNFFYVATSYGLYAGNELNQGNTFTLIQHGDFNELTIHNNRLFAIGNAGLFLITEYRAERVNHEFQTFQETCFIHSKQIKAFFLNTQGVFYSNLNQPYSLIKLNTKKNQTYTNLYAIDSTLILSSSDNEWYQYDLKSYNLNVLEPLDTNGSNPRFVINNDTLTIIKGKIAKKKRSCYTSIVGSTYTKETISTLLNGFHPYYQSFIIDKEKGIGSTQTANFAIENTLGVNEVYLDSDSTAWLSTNGGLIRISADYTKRIKELQPTLLVFSTSANQKNSFVQPINSSISTYRVKQGIPFEITLNGNGAASWNNLSYSYSLNKKPSNWSDWSIDSKIIFSDLAPGNHTCIFKARDARGVESAELSINIIIIPNFFRTQFTIVAIIILILLVIYTFNRWRSFYFALERFKLESIINRRTEELVKEKEKTDNLLARVLPPEMATELKETGKVNTQKFNMVTVLFSDIEGFTKITDELNPENLIDQLDKFFLYFDSVVDKYRIEKIKTIGDAYMCAGGIPHKNRTNPVEVVLAALEMLSYMREINMEHNPGQDIWDLRIGIDTGPVIAGVVGRNKLSYDIWGTTVNTASRMESSGEVGRINISGNTHILVQDYFLCTYRGKMPIKNKGDIEMYFVDGIKPVLSNNLDLYRPNIEFQIQLQFLRFGDLEELILEKLEKGLPKNLYYHNLKHTVDVYTQVELIGRSEVVNLEEQLLLQTAALFHDAGHLIDYDTHEEMGVKLAREILPEYQYSLRQIEIISDLIMVTKLPPRPKNLLEAIMCDADLDYLGRTDFIPVSNMLYKELHEHGRIGTIQEWNELQIKFIEKHQYFTNTARKLRNVNKNSQLENIKEWIEKNKL